MALNSLFVVQQTRAIDFMEDCSGLSYDAAEDVFWLVSDQSALIVKINFTGQVLLRLPLGLNKIEGIAVDRRRNLIYTVSDAKGKLYWYKLPDVN